MSAREAAVVDQADEHERLLRFLNMAPIGLAQIRPDGEIVMLNAKCTMLLLPVAGSTAPTNLFEVLHAAAPDLAERVQAYRPAYGKVCDELPLHFDLREQGRHEPLVIALSLVKLDKDRLMAVVDDVSLAVERDKALRRSHAFLHNSARLSGVGGWEYDVATRRLEWSDQARELLGLAPGRPATLRRCLKLCDAGHRPTLRQALTEGVGMGQRWDFELRATTPRGRTVWLRVVAEGEFEGERCVRVVGAVQDITARLAMQAAVMRGEQLLRGAIGALDEAFVLFDAKDRLVYCNDRYRRIYATSADAIVPGATYEHIVRTGVRRGQYPAAAGREEEFIAERMAQHLAGEATHIQHIDNGRILRVVDRTLPDGHRVGFRIDVTELVRAREMAEQADRVKSDFIATMSHELRTPLQVITGFSDLGKTFAEGQPQFRGMFADIHEGGQRMLKLVNGLLDISKIDGSADVLDLGERDVGDLLREVVRELTPMAAVRGVALDLPGELPPLTARVDAFRLQQVFRNVLANAIRFAPDGSPVAVAASEAPGQVQVTVADQGPGIPVAELESIFDPFKQSSRTRDGSGGTGLGLTICRRIMRAHGGSISAANTERGGALMTMRLPA